MKFIALDFASRLRSPLVWIPTALLAAATVVFWCSNLDVAVLRLCFSGDPTASGISDRFPLGEIQPWKTLYDWGVYPALWFGIGGAVVWVVSFSPAFLNVAYRYCFAKAASNTTGSTGAGFSRRWYAVAKNLNAAKKADVWRTLEAWRDPGLFFALVLIVGPGVLVNCVFKPYWSRPRPHAIKEFKAGADPKDRPRDFVPVWRRGGGDEDSSFPSGHAAMGFYWMAPAFVCYRRNRRRAMAFLLFGLAAGGAIGFARIVAGGHFPSDILWSAGIVYYTALLLAAPFHFGRAAGEEKLA